MLAAVHVCPEDTRACHLGAHLHSGLKLAGQAEVDDLTTNARTLTHFGLNLKTM